MRQMFKAAVILSAVDRMSKTVNRAFTNAEMRMQRVQKASDKFSRQSAQFARTTGMVGLATATALAVPVKKAMDFEQQITRLAVVSRATEKEQALLSKTARQMGATTQFSAMQAAEAMGFLAMAGFDVKKNVAAIPHVLNLSAAGAIDLGRAADISSNILSGFNLEAGQLSKANDILVNTFTQSNTTLEMLGSTMKYAAPVANTLGISISEVSAMAGKLGDAGIQGEMAGTAMRSMFLRLASPMKRGEKALASIGVATKDAQGNLKPMPALLAEIGNKIKALPTGRQAEVLKNVFGTEASSAAAVLTKQASTGELAAFITKLSVAGSTATVAEKQMATTQGQMLLLKSASEELAIVVGNMLLPPLASLMQKAAKIATRVAAWAERNPRLAKTIIYLTAGLSAFMITASAVGFLLSGIAGGVSAVATIFGALSKTVILFGKSFRIASLLISTAGIMLLITAIAYGAYLIYQNWDSIKAWFVNLWESVKVIFSNAWEWIKGLFFKYHPLGILVKHWDDVMAFFKGLGATLFNAGKNIIGNIWDGMKAMAHKPVELIQNIVGKVRDFLPFSPAKVGPLKDLHRIKLIETIAGTMTPRPMVAAMQTTLGAAVQSGGVPGGGSGGQFGGGSLVHYAPVINFSGPVDDSTKSSFERMLREHSAELMRMLREAMDQEKRVKF